MWGRLSPCTLFQRLQSPAPWLSSALSPSGCGAGLGWAPCRSGSRVPQAGKGNPTFSNTARHEHPSEVHTESNQPKEILERNSGGDLLTTALLILGGIFHLQKQRSNTTKPRELLKQVLTQMQLFPPETAWWNYELEIEIGVRVTHPRTSDNGGSINIFCMTEI